jgi:hypothetical protein
MKKEYSKPEVTTLGDVTEKTNNVGDSYTTGGW